MSSDRPFALLETWTTYGSWLPGDPRGYVSDTLCQKGDWTPKINTPGAPYVTDDPQTLRYARERQKGATVRLTPQQALCVAHALLEAANARGWRILRCAIMSNHVHVVVAHCPDDGPEVRRILKGVSQAALNRLAGSPQRWWTQRGSDRYLHTLTSIEAAVQYVVDQQWILAEIIDGQVHSRGT